MNHFETYHKPQFSVKEYLLPFLAQYLILMVCIMLHRLFIGHGPLLGPEVLVGDEMSSPTAGRLVFCILAFVLAVVLTGIASKKAKAGAEYIPFFLGLFAGTFLWQSIGEDLWNFSVNGVNFVQLGSVSVFPIFVITVLFVIYAVRNETLDWGVWCALFGFLCNWLGHYVMLGTYPFVAAYFEESAWNQGIAYVSGAVLAVFGIYLGVCSAKDRKGRLFASIVTYIATGVIAFGMMEG